MLEIVITVNASAIEHFPEACASSKVFRILGEFFLEIMHRGDFNFSVYVLNILFTWILKSEIKCHVF